MYSREAFLLAKKLLSYPS